MESEGQDVTKTQSTFLTVQPWPGRTSHSLSLGPRTHAHLRGFERHVR